MRHRIIFLLAGLSLVGAGCGPAPVSRPVSTVSDGVADSASNTASKPAAAVHRPALTEPLSDALARVTKKDFGLKVSPADSPVQPERFSGYHTALDFETTPEEQAADVPVKATCDGVLALKESATGYGGVAVQRCRIAEEDVTVIYGHLRLSSVAATGKMLKAGETFAVLGRGFSRETDGERKHLHFGVHRGRAIDIRGYVQNREALKDWVDPATLLR